MCDTTNNVRDYLDEHVAYTKINAASYLQSQNTANTLTKEPIMEPFTLKAIGICIIAAYFIAKLCDIDWVSAKGASGQRR
ncbi:MAG: hypothetical protein U5P41_03155 [Gammaproteobacteria bacterium]|nr:hypothetical protein [Gammaproteobacteria bacterium]